MIRGRKRSSGFTLVELMIVVAIIGILAAIAIPAFSRYIKRSKTAEAVGHVNKMVQGSVAYYEADHNDVNGVPVAKQFPGAVAADPTGLATCCAGVGGKCPGWPAPGNASMEAMSLSIGDPHYYVVRYQSAGTAAASTFTAQAIGDLDCDATLATFQRTGRISAAGDVTVGGMVITNEIE
jgi:prepilin-type N-terminal cleavage/methylation domain-containing protein